MTGGVVEIDLVGANAEAADDQQVLGLAEDLFAESGLGANTDDVNIARKHVFVSKSVATSRLLGATLRGRW
jgi:hypothetical protein